MVARSAVPASASRLSIIGQDHVTDTGHTGPRTASIKAHSAHHPPDGVPIRSSLTPTEMKHRRLVNRPEGVSGLLEVTGGKNQGCSLR